MENGNIEKVNKAATGMNSTDVANLAANMMKKKIGEPVTADDIQMIRHLANYTRALAIEETATKLSNKADSLKESVKHLLS